MTNALDTDQFLGRVLDGRYRVEELVARGGMATVYRATDMRLVRTVAVKVLSSSLVTDSGFVDRFTQEARSAASLTHPNVVAVHDQGVAEGHPYLVMEFVPGQTIREVLSQSGPFTSAHALEIMKSVLAGLVAAHQAGFIHRDIKPENVLITADGHIKVTDFGLARVIDDTPVSDSTGTVLLGTMAYLSPEQVQQLTLDERSDVYSAGILLFEMLTGRVPYTGSSPLDVAFQHVNQDVPAPSTLQPDVPPAVDHLVLAATRRNPADRMQSAHSFLDAVVRAGAAVPQAESLSNALSDTLVLSEPITTVPRGSHRATAEQPATPVTAPARTERVRRAHGTDGTTSQRRFAQPRRRRMPRTAAALVAIALALGAGWVFTGQYVPMPDVVGATQDAAMSTLTEAGLTVRVEQEFSEDVPLGTVVRTAPDAGTRARKGLPVTLVVSKGLERYTIPDDLVGKSEADARSALAALTLVVSEVRQEYSDSVKKGLVLSTDPASGVPLRRGTEVSLVISKGPAPVDVPGILGMDIKEATAALAKVGLLLDVTDQINDDTPEGTILVVKPLPGTTVERGTTISVTVSKGPVLVMVPDVVGLGVKAARTKLEAAGFTVRTEDVLPVVNLNKVYSQSIAGGQLAPKGSTIVLKIV